MDRRRIPVDIFRALFLIAAISSCISSAHAKDAAKPCITTTEAAQQSNQDVCLAAHVYDVVELRDGTRFLDLCPPEVEDSNCRIFIESPAQDRGTVGELNRYRGQDVRIRGIVRPMHGRMAILLSHARQFSGGPEKFRPNPKLLRSFDAQSDRTAVRDPNLASSGRHRSFMNTRDREDLPAKKP